MIPPKMQGNFLTHPHRGDPGLCGPFQELGQPLLPAVGGAIRKETVTLLEGKDLSIDTVIESADALKADKGDEFILPGAAGTLWHADFAENKLVLDLYN